MLTRKPVVLITGTSSGIGLALLRLLAQRAEDYCVIGTARTESLSKLKAQGLVENDNLHFLPLDVTQTNECESLIAEVQQRWGGVDILINNAGISYRSVVEHLTEDDVKLQFETNLFGPLHLARLCLPQMRAKRSGRIINVSSVGGMMAMPTMGLYSASKFALEGISEALYYEMRPWDVHVSLIQPGFVRSNSFKNVYISDAAERALNERGTYSNYYWNMGHFISKLMNNAGATPESIARQIIRLMERNNPPLRVPASLDAWFFTLMARILPRRFYHWFLYKRLPGIRTWGTGQHDDVINADSLEEILPASSKRCPSQVARPSQQAHDNAR